jgi:hypothetical protein
MLDGLGLVYEKQGNTGAAAYTPPSNTDPFAVVTNDLASQVDFQRKKKERDAIKQDDLNNKIIEAINPEGWSLDNRQYFYKSGNDLKLEAAILRSKGKNLNDITDPEVMAFMDKSKRVLNEASLSAEQGKLFDVMYNEFSKNPNKYDKERTAQNVEKWKALPMEERFKTDPRSLFAPKYNKFAAADPIKNYDKFSDISPKGGTRINRGKIDQYLNEIASDQEVIDSYQQGLERGDWSNPQEWKTSQAQFIESQIQNKADRYEKPDKVDSDGGLGFEEIMMQFDMNKKTNLPVMNASVSTKEKTGSKLNATVYQPTTLGNVNYTVSSGDVYDLNSGKPTETGIYSLKTGTIGVGIRNAIGQIIPENAKVPYKGKQISVAEALKLGIVRYEPIVYGVAEIGSGPDKKEVEIVVDPTNLKSMTTGFESKEEKNTMLRTKAYSTQAGIMNQKAGYGTQKDDSSTSGSGTSGSVASSAAKKIGGKKEGAKEPLSFKDWRAANGNQGTIPQYNVYKSSFNK